MTNACIANDAMIPKELTNNFHISFLLVQQNILHFEIPNILILLIGDNEWPKCQISHFNKVNSLNNINYHYTTLHDIILTCSRMQTNSKFHRG